MKYPTTLALVLLTILGFTVSFPNTHKPKYYLAITISDNYLSDYKDKFNDGPYRILVDSFVNSIIDKNYEEDIIADSIVHILIADIENSVEPVIVMTFNDISLIGILGDNGINYRSEYDCLKTPTMLNFLGNSVLYSYYENVQRQMSEVFENYYYVHNDSIKEIIIYKERSGADIPNLDFVGHGGYIREIKREVYPDSMIVTYKTGTFLNEWLYSEVMGDSLLEEAPVFFVDGIDKITYKWEYGEIIETTCSKLNYPFTGTYSGENDENYLIDTNNYAPSPIRKFLVKYHQYLEQNK